MIGQFGDIMKSRSIFSRVWKMDRVQREKIRANLFCIIIRFIVNYANRLE